MLAIYPLPQVEPEAQPEAAPQPAPTAFAPPREVMLADGTLAMLEGLPAETLHELQFDQEQRFARAIQSFPPRSRERSLVTAQAYDTVCALLSAQRAAATGVDGPLVMGFDRRYASLVLNLLERQVARGIDHPRLFEIGYGSGALLNEVRGYGFPVGGIEVSTTMREQAVAILGRRHAEGLMLGDFLDVQVDDLPGRPSVIYWNDVLEHVAPDEAFDYVAHARTLLAPGGTLVTITPNWLMRPSDVTGDFRPARSEACGLHLKEYRLAEVVALLKRAGFRRVATPLFATRRQMSVVADGFCWPKRMAEPLLDRLPVKLARLLCRGWAMSCTLATK